MQKYVFRNISIVNEGEIKTSDVLIENGRIERIDKTISVKERVIEIEGQGRHLLPGLIDDQVHFREPGFTHKATIYSESKAAIAGGVTSFMEMPNTIPNALTQKLLEDKYEIAKHTSLANYSFYMGVSNDNADEVLKTNDKRNTVCGVKIFMGSSTGNMLVDKREALEKIFSESELLIATHCEDEAIIRDNYENIKKNNYVLNPADHPLIRDVEACYSSSSYAASLAKKFNSRLHILHISTAKELELFTNSIPLKEKKITAEVCVHHLHFTANDYEKSGYLIKCNPAIKSAENKTALWAALLDDRLDVIATDHAPHLLSEKQPPYEKAHAGLPLVQHSLLLMLDYHKKGFISLENIVRKTSHAVADCFKINDRGFIREGYYADVAVIDLNAKTNVSKENILYKCGWSPLENMEFPAVVTHTFVNGYCVYNDGKFYEYQKGQRMIFN
ncbi:dihydroorotase [soil metagenome]